MAEDFYLAAALVDQRTDDADRCGLAGAIGTEQRVEIALLDGEVDAFQRPRTVVVGLGKVFDGEGFHEAAYCNRAPNPLIPRNALHLVTPVARAAAGYREARRRGRQFRVLGELSDREHSLQRGLV